MGPLKSFLTVLTGFLGLVGGIVVLFAVFAISILLTILFTDLAIKIREDKEPEEVKEPQVDEKGNLCSYKIPDEPDKYFKCTDNDGVDGNNCNNKYVVKRYILLKSKEEKEYTCTLKFKELDGGKKTGVVFLWFLVAIFGIISFSIFFTIIMFFASVDNKNTSMRRRRVIRTRQPVKVVVKPVRPVRVVRPIRPRRPIRRR